MPLSFLWGGDEVWVGPWPLPCAPVPSQPSVALAVLMPPENGRRWRFLIIHSLLISLLLRAKLLLCSVTESCPTLCHPTDCSTPGFPVLHYLLEFAQSHVHWVSDALQEQSWVSWNCSEHVILNPWNLSYLKKAGNELFWVVSFSEMGRNLFSNFWWEKF